MSFHPTLSSKAGSSRKKVNKIHRMFKKKGKIQKMFFLERQPWQGIASFTIFKSKHEVYQC